MLSFFSKKDKFTDLSWLEIDVHTHILPGFDGSASDISSALAYIKGLSALGFRKLICAPIRSVSEDKQSIAAYHSMFMELRESSVNISDHIDLVLAGEYLINQTFEANSSLHVLGGNFVLISIPDTAFDGKLSQAVFDLIIRNYRPVLAHPEKYPFLAKDKKKLKRLKHKGCLLQLDLLSVTGHYGKEVRSAAISLLKDNFYDLAGTNLQNIQDLQVLQEFTQNGKIGELMGNYPFRNRALFSS